MTARIRHTTGVRRLLLALAAAGLAAVPAAEGASTLTLVFTSVTTVTQPHDRPPVGQANKGDSIDFKDLLINKRAQLGKKTNKPAAWDAGTIVYTSATTQRIEGVTTVPGYGTLAFAGPLVAWKDKRTVHVPVVRGTGAFAGAHGTLIIGTGVNAVPNTYVLVLPKPLAPPGSA